MAKGISVLLSQPDITPTQVTHVIMTYNNLKTRPGLICAPHYERLAFCAATHDISHGTAVGGIKNPPDTNTNYLGCSIGYRID